MTIHINQKPLVVAATTGNTTTNLPQQFTGMDGIEVYNPDTVNMAFVTTSGAAADATCQHVPPNTTKLFRKDANAKTVSVIMAAGAGVSVRFNPSTAFISVQ